MQAADAAGDGGLQAWILSIQAMLAASTNRHQDVIDLTSAGLAAAGEGASATAVKLASLPVGAQASLGDRAAAEAAMALATVDGAGPCGGARPGLVGVSGGEACLL